MAEDPTHPSGVTVEIVGIERGDRGRSCEEHDVCGTVVEEDTLLRLRKKQILVDGEEETEIACYWVTDGIDRCRVGFLKRHMVKHARRFDGTLVQVTKMYSDDARHSDTAERKKKYGNHGCALAVIVSRLAEEDLKGKAKDRKVQGGGGTAQERKARDEEGKVQERKVLEEEGKADDAISWKCAFCSYTNVDVTCRNCPMCRTKRTAKKMKTGL